MFPFVEGLCKFFKSTFKFKYMICLAEIKENLICPVLGHQHKQINTKSSNAMIEDIHKVCHASFDHFTPLPLSQNVANLGHPPLKYVTLSN